MLNQGTSTIVQYTRRGDLVTAYAVQRSWLRGVFAETARWLVPGGIGAMRRESAYGIAPGPLGYGRADLIEGGVVRPACSSFDHLPYLALNP